MIKKAKITFVQIITGVLGFFLCLWLGSYLLSGLELNKTWMATPIRLTMSVGMVCSAIITVSGAINWNERRLRDE